MNGALALKLLDIILLGVTMVPEARRAAEALAIRLRGLGGRDPSPEDWAEIDAETNTLLAELDDRAAEARAQLSEP